MLGHTGFRRLWGNRRRGVLAVVGTVLALTGIAIALAPPPSSQAAQGTRWLIGMPGAGMLTTNAGQCSVTVVSEWLAITAKHCGTGNPKLFLNVADVSKATPYQVKSINPSPTLDVEAIFLSKRTGLPVLSHRAVTQGPFSVWGYGHDYSSKFTNNLTRADFNHADACPASLSTGGSLCWQTSAVNSVCAGDSGGAVTQNGAVIGMVTAVAVTSKNPDGSLDCSKVLDGQALTVPQMQPWLDQMIKDADPTD